MILGDAFFSNCSKLKKVDLPAGISLPINSDTTFENCTALEEVNIYAASTMFFTINAGFPGCTSLHTLDLYQVNGYEYDEAGNAIGYTSVTKAYPLSYALNTFHGLKAMKYVRLSGLFGAYVQGPVFKDSGIEIVVVNSAAVYIQETTDGEPFSRTTALKDVWINASSLTVTANSFANLSTDVNFYFYNYTYEQVVAMAKGDSWFTNADEKAHFYFKDTIPEGTKIPEGV